MATLVPCLQVLRAEFNQAFPGRDRASDGWIGDEAHQSRASDHNPDSRGIVHAVDVDEDLRDAQTRMREAVDEVVRRHRTGADNRLTYVIYERTIWSARYSWAPRAYTGTNPHSTYAHFSASYLRTREIDLRPFGVLALARREDLPVPLTQAEIDAIAVATADKVWAKRFPLPAPVYGTGDRAASDLLRYQGSLSVHTTETKNALAPQLDAIEAHLQYLRSELDAHTTDPADTPPPPAG